MIVYVTSSGMGPSESEFMKALEFAWRSEGSGACDLGTGRMVEVLDNASV